MKLSHYQPYSAPSGFDKLVNDVVDRVAAKFEHRPDVGGMSLPCVLVPVGKITVPMVAKTDRIKVSISGKLLNHLEAVEALSNEIIALIESKLEDSYIGLYELLRPHPIVGQDAWGFTIRYGQLSKSGK